MSITLDLGPELEARLRGEADRQGKPVESLLKGWIEQKSEPVTAAPKFYETATPAEWAAEFLRWTASFPTPKNPLPDEALRRESMYEDRW